MFLDAASRNAERFPENFMFQLTLEEAELFIALTRCVEHEAGVEPACFGFKAQRGCRQPTARVLDQAAGIEPAWAAFRAQLGYQQPTPE